MRRTLAPLIAAAALLASCDAAPPAETDADPAAEIDAAPQGAVVREAPPADPPAFQPVAAAVIQSQPGPSGARVDLTRTAVTGDVLTVQVSVSHPDGQTIAMDLDEVNVVDDATAQRYGVLRDGGGKWMAAPLGGADRVSDYVSAGAPEVYWFKFPAPPPTSPTVSINLPGIGPFDGVPVTRR